MPPKRKGKGKAPEPTGYDDIMEAADYEEGQATRYQFGEKAQRHYEEAARLYGLACQVGSTSDEEKYDAEYNLARILYALATEIYGIPQCSEALLKAIELYRKCSSYNVADKTDALFNLAQAMQSLGEMISESGPSTSLRTLSSPETVWLEARQVLEQLIQMQLASLSAHPSAISELGGSDKGVTASSQEDGDLDSMYAPEGTDAVAEEYAVTPSTIIESILAAIQSLLSLAELIGTFPGEDVEKLLEHATLLDREGGYMKKEIENIKQDAAVASAETRLSSGSMPDIRPLQEIIQVQRKDLTAERRPDPALYSNLADSLVVAFEISLLEESTPTELAPLAEAIEYYEKARSILANSFQRPASTPAHHIPSLQSANCQASSQSCLMLALLVSKQEQSGAVPANSSNLVEKARNLAIEALNVPSGPFKAQYTECEGVIRFTRAIRSAIREDYRTVLATRAAVLWLTRFCLIQLRLLVSPEATVTAQIKSLHAVLKATWPVEEDLRHALSQYVIDSRLDGLSRVYARLSSEGEDALWRTFVEAS